MGRGIANTKGRHWQGRHCDWEGPDDAGGSVVVR
jgi:hypothetical protein